MLGICSGHFERGFCFFLNCVTTFFTCICSGVATLVEICMETAELVQDVYLPLLGETWKSKIDIKLGINIFKLFN